MIRTGPIIVILLILFLTPCFSEDRIHTYINDEGHIVYTNELPTTQNSVPNNQNSNAINPFNAQANKDTAQKPEFFNPPLTPQQPHPNYNAIENNMLNSFARIVVFQFLMLIIVFLLWLFAFRDIIRHEFTGSNKLIWFLAVTFVPIIGPILYFTMAGRHKIIPDKPDDNYMDSETVPSSHKRYTPPDI
jgi:hypothetical protein